MQQPSATDLGPANRDYGSEFLARLSLTPLDSVQGQYLQRKIGKLSAASLHDS